MIRRSSILALFSMLAVASWAVSKPHVITFGKWTTVLWSPDAAADKPIALKVRPLVVDGKIKEYTTGTLHEITDRLFVVRRVFRVNDSLPEESGSAPRWAWQRGGWLLVDRTTGRVSPVNLPEFDAFYSVASWYRDYVAYCGVSDDGKHIYTIITQLGRRKPVVKLPFSGEITADAPPDSACPTPPSWQRGPARATFDSGAKKLTIEVRGHVVDVVNDSEEEQEALR
jgi:hypothetical protein